MRSCFRSTADTLFGRAPPRRVALPGFIQSEKSVRTDLSAAQVESTKTTLLPSIHKQEAEREETERKSKKRRMRKVDDENEEDEDAEDDEKEGEER